MVVSPVLNGHGFCVVVQSLTCVTTPLHAHNIHNSRAHIIAKSTHSSSNHIYCIELSTYKPPLIATAVCSRSLAKMQRVAHGSSVRGRCAVSYNGSKAAIFPFKSMRRCRMPRAPGLSVSAVAAPADKAPSRSAPRRAPHKKSPDEDIVEKGMRELPRPADVQQTLARSFTLGGAGLHTGEYSTVRVRPARAGDGRYFVRVPKGTNAGRFALRDDSVGMPESRLGAEAVIDPEIEAARVALFTRYLAAQEDAGFNGTFVDYVLALDADEAGAAELPDSERAALADARAAAERAGAAAAGGGDGAAADDEPFEEVTAFDASNERRIPATLEAAYAEEGIPFVTLVAPDGDADNASEADFVINPTLLLAALEACGVDNARIEIEGGPEVPALDNSALGWVLSVQQAGLRVAPVTDAAPGGGSGGGGGGGGDGALAAARGAIALQEPLTVRRGEAFVSYYPGVFQKLTAGVDAQDVAPIIGQQWYSWRVARDYHFRYELAPARGWAASVDELYALRAAGYAQGGGEALHVIGHGGRWWNELLVRFANDEPARHAATRLVGALSLLGAGGNAGLPAGHVVAFNADDALLVEFGRALAVACDGKDAVVDSADLLQAQLSLLQQQAAARAKAGEPRRAREAALERLGGPAAAAAE